MGKGCRDWDFHNFYCINCGNRGIPIARAGNKLKGKNHRKLMYCPTCKHTVNHIECRNQFEVEEFLEDFKNGVYEDEVRAELEYERNNPRYSSLICDGGMSGLRQEHLGKEAFA